MNKTILNAIIYTAIILFISVLIVTLAPSIHQKQLNNETAIENDQIFISYFQSGNPLEMANIKGITSQEVKHMFDVKKILVISSIATFILAIILLLIWDKNESIVATMLSPILFMWISIPTFLFVNFNKLFEVFHKIFFPQGNYMFPMDSVLITTYPIEFFMNMGLCIGKIFLFISVGLLLIKVISDKLHILLQRF